MGEFARRSPESDYRRAVATRSVWLSAPVPLPSDFIGAPCSDDVSAKAGNPEIQHLEKRRRFAKTRPAGPAGRWHDRLRWRRRRLRRGDGSKRDTKTSDGDGGGDRPG